MGRNKYRQVNDRECLTVYNVHMGALDTLRGALSELYIDKRGSIKVLLLEQSTIKCPSIA